MAPASTSTDDPKPTCGSCKKPSSDLSRCGRCLDTLYCSKECQRNDHSIHKVLCKTFADTPSPEPSNKDLRRIIFFNPLKLSPEILWIREEPGWAMKLLNSVADRGTTPAPSGHTLDLKRIPHQPSADHHVSWIYRDGGDGSIYDGSAINKAFRSAASAAGLPKARLFLGPLIAARREGKDHWGEFLIPGGPKLLDATMEDFADTLRWLMSAPLFEARSRESTYLRILAMEKLAPGSSDEINRLIESTVLRTYSWSEKERHLRAHLLAIWEAKQREQ